MRCVGEDGLARYLAGDLEPRAHGEVDAHLDSCAECAAILDELTMRTEIRAVGAEPAGRPEPGVSPSDKLRWLERHYSLQIGDVIDGKYRLEAVIGEGGMGIVVRAAHLRLHDRVALKFMHPSMADNPTHAARFVREARAAVRLRSENVARVLDLGEVGEHGPYIVMEYLEGTDLLAHLKKRAPLGVARALDLGRQAASGVAAAHEAGIVHRDLKPGNLFLTEHRGEVILKVLDFGVSKYLEGDSLAVTGTNMVVGSPMYMAPELFETARNATPASDVWALGVIIYRMLTGRLPFFGEALPELVAKVHFGQPTPIAHWRPHLAPEICQVIDVCLTRDPRARFPDAGALCEALERIPERARFDPELPPPPPDHGLELYTLPDAPAAPVPAPPAQAVVDLPPALGSPVRRWLLAGAGAVVASVAFGAILALATRESPPQTPPPKAPATAIAPADAAPEPDAEIAEITADAAVAPAPDARERRRPARERRERTDDGPEEPVLLIPDSE